MRKVLNTYNKDALRHNLRNAKVTWQIIRQQINRDGFTVYFNKGWSEWYLIPTSVTSPHCPTQGIYNVVEEFGKFNSEHDLLKHYLEIKM